MVYAQGTEVSVERTQAELSAYLRKRGTASVAVGQTNTAGVIQETQLRTAVAAEERRRWRALLLVVKAKFEAVDSEIVTFESEFLAQTVMPDNQTVLEHVREPIARAYIENHVRPLLELSS